MPDICVSQAESFYRLPLGNEPRRPSLNDEPPDDGMRGASYLSIAGPQRSRAFKNRESGDVPQCRTVPSRIVVRPPTHAGVAKRRPNVCAPRLGDGALSRYNVGWTQTLLQQRSSIVEVANLHFIRQFVRCKGKARARKSGRRWTGFDEGRIPNIESAKRFGNASFRAIAYVQASICGQPR